MPAPRKPTAHLELVGAFKKNPQRRRDSEPVCEEGVGPAPGRLTEGQAEAWDYLVGSAVPGVLTKMDRAYLELCAIMLDRVWRGERDKPLNGTDIDRAGKMLGQLGFTPSQRSRVVVPREGGKSEFDDF